MRTQTIDNLLKFEKRVPYLIGVDASTTCTGIAVQTLDRELIAVIEVSRHRDLPRRMFKSKLKIIFNKLFYGCDIRLVVVEQPYGGEKFMIMQNTTMLIKNSIVAFENVDVKKILPSVWRSEYLKSPEYKGRKMRSRVKVAVRDETVKRYPFVLNMSYHSTDGFDGFEAVGVLDGYMDKNYVDGDISKTRKINTSMPLNKHKFFAQSFTYRGDDYIIEARKILGDMVYGSNLEKMIFNPTMSTIENCRRATVEDTGRTVFLEIPYGIHTMIENWNNNVWVKEGSDIHYGVITFKK